MPLVGLKEDLSAKSVESKEVDTLQSIEIGVKWNIEVGSKIKISTRGESRGKYSEHNFLKLREVLSFICSTNLNLKKFLLVSKHSASSKHSS